jgi:sulfate adenylyltransferase/3'-phosphoadenosine 5'-phosphosulfate synthase
VSKGFVVWLTGLSGAGKTTIAQRLTTELTTRGRRPEVLDGDEVRTNLSAGLGFSKEDRDTNIRRIGYVARLLARNGAAVITAAISPYREVRAEVRAATPGFVEVYVRCSLDELVRRDVKGLYVRALAGEIANFTGVSDPYEAPENPDVVVDTERESVEESVQAVLRALVRLGHLPGEPVESLGTADDAAAAAQLPRLAVGAREVADLRMLATGALSPLTGFMDRSDYASVVEGGRLASGAPFTIPVLLRSASVPSGDRIALEHDGTLVGVMDVADVFDTDAGREALAVYGTDDDAHPGVRLLHGDAATAIAGPVTLLAPHAGEFARWDLTPSEVRAARDERGWRSMVGFQTRNPVHRAHEYLHKVALESVDGLLLHPLVGETKADDIPAAVRMRCYEALLDGYYPRDRTLLAVNPAWMRYAGPKEAVFHALIRRNYGCTHFIVGRDHAGVGSYYDTYAAQRIFDQYAPGELGIEILRFEHTMWCTACGAMVSRRTCPHPSDLHLTLSGTRVRELLQRGEELPVEFTRPEVAAILAAAAEGEREAALVT